MKQHVSISYGSLGMNLLLVGGLSLSVKFDLINTPV